MSLWDLDHASWSISENPLFFVCIALLALKLLFICFLLYMMTVYHLHNGLYPSLLFVSVAKLRCVYFLNFSPVWYFVSGRQKKRGCCISRPQNSDMVSLIYRSHSNSDVMSSYITDYKPKKQSQWIQRIRKSLSEDHYSDDRDRREHTSSFQRMIRRLVSTQNEVEDQVINEMHTDVIVSQSVVLDFEEP